MSFKSVILGFWSLFIVVLTFVSGYMLSTFDSKIAILNSGLDEKTIIQCYSELQ